MEDEVKLYHTHHPNQDGHRSQTDPVISQSSGGLILPTRSANVILLQDEASSSAQTASSGPSATGSSGLVRRDSLEDTKSFYGVQPNSPPQSHSSIKRPRSSASRATTTATATGGQRVRSSSLLSSYSLRSATSPPRTPAPLPTPRGFLSPKKPVSAIRLEKKERTNNHLNHGAPSANRTYRSSLPTEYEDRSQTDSHPSQAATRLQDRVATEITSVRSTSPVQEEGQSLGTALALSDLGLGTRNGTGTGRSRKEKPSDIRPAGWEKSIGRSVTEMSTPPRTAESELSSEGLVNMHKSAEATESGHNARQAPDARSRKSWLPRSSPAATTPTQKRKRRYETFDNPLTVFFCGGHMMTGGDYYPFFIAVFVLMLGVSGVWIGTTGVWLWQHGTEYGLVKGGGVAITIIFVYLFGIAFSSLVTSSIRDPGIIPRNLDPDPPWYEEGDWWDFNPRELTVNDEKITVKYCHTCGSYRPPRSSHCRLCGNCVDGIDHHCSYLHNCVGKRNYFSFLVTIVSSAFADAYIVVFSAVHFYLLCHFDHVSFGRALADSPGAAVSFLLGVLTLMPISFLMWYHLRLLLWNLTTVEQIRSTANKSLLSTGTRPDNPFATNSFLSNIVLASIGRPQFPSWIDASGWVEDEKREVNPALRDLSWAREGG